MKFLKFLLVACCIATVFYSCSKTDGTTPPSIGTLSASDTTGDCFPVTVHGKYVAGIPLTDDNYFDLEVNITAVGTFTMSTDSVNGMYFSSMGEQRFGYTGKNTVHLYGHGKPISSGVTTFTVSYNGTTCTISLIVDAHAAGSYVFDTTGHVITAAVSGSYTTGVPLTNSDSVLVTLSVLHPGSLHLTSDTVNGMFFSGTSIFNDSGIHILTLYGNGVPQTSGKYTFALLDSLGDSCKFEIPVAPYGGVSSSFKLAGDGGTCFGYSTYGTYIAGVKLMVGDSVVTQVTAAKAGPYSIVTEPINGVTFSGTGNFDSAGIYNIALHGYGTPVSPGTYNYTAKSDSSSCTFSVSYGQGNAIYTLGGEPNGCTGFVLTGDYKTDVPLTFSNTVSFDVNVTTTGTYNFSVPTTNGITFSGSGTFVTPGPQQVTLIASGTPQTPGITNFTIPSRAGNCKFTINVISSVAVYEVSASGYGLCVGFKLNGAYKAGTALTPSNTLVTQVNVKYPGPYSISTDSIDGFIFSAEDTFHAAGIQTVTLRGSGTPKANGTFSGVVADLPNACTFNINVTGTGSSGGSAAFTLGGAPSSCTGFVLGGTYTAGTALSGSNTVKLNVNVTTAGTYTVSTPSVDGMVFSASGTFGSTGAQTITLTGTGTPTAGGTFTINPVAGASTCSFSVNVTGGVAAPGSITASVNGTPKTFNTGVTGQNTGTAIQIDGASSGGETMGIVLASSNLQPGTYTQTSVDPAITAMYTSGSTVYNAGYQFSNITVVVTNVSADRVTGTFSGTFKETIGSGSVTITNGTFDVPIQ
ncbi:hypothetical protein [Ferruginibacter albus]|uniref:hypothetical protein n=1 Tax=Ferruginibacter albus TaxID=2875540 RepID=UPI001CC43D58|nr:hypothetical protein [Ferruginibacter albus]UAY52792.1 hypothetical protein K9M53_03705 [Ferruginibacter albus]